MRRTDRYGSRYWCIGVPEAICPDRQIYLMACRLVVENGTLLCWRDQTLRQDEAGYEPLPQPQLMNAWAPGHWLYFFAASVWDGSAVNVDHWKGEVLEPEQYSERLAPKPSAPLPAEESKDTKPRSSHPERNRMTVSLRYRILKRDGFKCQACGKTPQDDGVSLEVDHRIPISKGGTSDEDNLQTLCKPCNQSKSDGHP